MINYRNYKGISLQKLREVVDPIINTTHDELQDCYYHYWKFDKSSDFYGLNKKETPEESKKQFDELHGILFLIHDILLHRYNLTLKKEDRIPEEKYNKTSDIEGNSIDKDQLALQLLYSKNELFNFIKEVLKNKCTDSLLFKIVDGII